MPHSGDKTVVTVAGDHEVRVFDLEHAGKSGEASNASSAAAVRHTRGFGSRGLPESHHGAKYLTDGNTNARVYRSHSDRVKRIVTESSPHLFLTCSEDGEVRQFDTRLPSSAYPAARGGRGFRLHAGDHDDSNVPPPLISYKRFRLDLNTISCSPSQPHYIILGGAHLHCFLHDRRMVGRDSLTEKGIPAGSPTGASDFASDGAEDLMGEATRCVRRFAPSGKRKMGRTENGHVTACKISDAHPNEMIASWSGDHIYSFDLVRSADARYQTTNDSTTVAGKCKARTRESRDRKRKRKQEGSQASLENLAQGRPQHRSSGSLTGPDDVVLRVRYENGQSEDISVESTIGERVIEQSREAVLNESQKRSMRIAKSVVKIRKLLFSVDPSARDERRGYGLSAHSASFTGVLGSAAALLPEMDDIIRTWAYPVGPSPEEVAFHATLRQHRDSARRFVQASGSLAKVFGGKLQTASSSNPALEYFDMVKSSELEGSLKEPREMFRYTFLKAILLWLEGGPTAILNGFKENPSASGRLADMFPIPKDSDESGIDDHLIPMLIQLASIAQDSSEPTAPIVNVDASRFEADERRIIFANELVALQAFRKTIKIPLKDLSNTTKAYIAERQDAETSHKELKAQDRQAAFKFWGYSVARGLLMNAGQGVNFALVDRAYGGLGLPRDVDEGRVQDDIDPNTDDLAVVLADIRTGSIGREENGESGEASADALGEEENAETDDENEEEDDTDTDDEDEHEEAEDDEGLSSQFIFRSSAERNRLRSQVQKEVSVSAHSRKYSGHCNVKTVKDVNFFGLQDEYVVSGCDSGHLFIWDRKTSRLLNILKGDGEVVNVVQGSCIVPTKGSSTNKHQVTHTNPSSLFLASIIPSRSSPRTTGLSATPGLGVTLTSILPATTTPRPSNGPSLAGAGSQAPPTRSKRPTELHPHHPRPPLLTTKISSRTKTN